MYTTSGLAPWVVILITPTLGKRYVPPIAARAPTIAPVTQVVLGTALGGALDPMATRPPEVRHGKVRLDNTGESDLTINVINSFGDPLSIFYGSNAGGPSPNGDPGPGTLTSSTQLSVPPGWAGRITIGKNYDPMGSKIEASFVAPDFVPDVDVSYVDGYSIPITCSCSGVVVTGCNGKATP